MTKETNMKTDGSSLDNELNKLYAQAGRLLKLAKEEDLRLKEQRAALNLKLQESEDRIERLEELLRDESYND